MRAVGLRLEGPMQAWGGPVAGDDRPSIGFPTKSGVLGLVAGALGIDRADVTSLVALHRELQVVVRVDQPGVRGVDFHTAQAVPRGDRGVAETVVSRRSYLYDASFAVLLLGRGEGVGPTLQTIVEALAHPRFAPALGRRACPPSKPVLEARELMEGDDWRDLLGQVAVAGVPRGAAQLDVFVEGGRLPGSLRELRLRDHLVGPLPRMFGERTVCHYRVPGPAEPGDTVDPWFPS